MTRRSVLNVIIIWIGVSAYLQAHAGKHPYAEVLPILSHEVVEIQKKHGMPVEHNRGENPWYAESGSPGHYTIYLNRADEIPTEAKLEIVRLCMDLYEQRGRTERFRILMYRGTQAERRGVFGGLNVNPFFDLTIGGGN